MLAVLVGINVIGALIDALAPSPSGPASSSFATKPEGLAAWAELAERNGIRVRALRDSPADATLGGERHDRGDGRRGAEPRRGARAADVRRARRPRDRRRRAARLDRDAARRDAPPEWDDDGPETREGHGDRAGDDRRRAREDLRRRPLERTDGALAGDEGSLLIVRRVGSGRIALLADTSPLQNRLLDEDDNAAFALALSGRGPLTFVESVHGYGPQRGLAAIPARFGWALIGLLLAALVFMVARGRRLGPPERERRELPPPRRAYVDALAATMARGKEREAAVAPVREEARRRLARRAGLREDAPDEAWLAAARGAGLDDDEARALSGRAEDDEAVVATGRALAALAGPDRRTRDGGT